MGVVGRVSLLPTVLQEGLKGGILSAAEAVALLPLVDHADKELLCSIANSAKATASDQRAKIVELVSYDELLRYGRGRREEIRNVLEQISAEKGEWLSNLCATTTFLKQLKELPEKQRKPREINRAIKNSDNNWATGLTYDSADHVQAAFQAAREEAKKCTEYLSSPEAFDLLIPHVPMNRRWAFLSGLSEMLGSNDYFPSAEHLHKVIELWRSDTGVQRWCRTELPVTVQNRLVRLGAWMRYGQSPLTDLISDTQLPDSEVCNLFVAGLA
jgi:hypothetical protein